MLLGRCCSLLTKVVGPGRYFLACVAYLLSRKTHLIRWQRHQSSVMFSAQNAPNSLIECSKCQAKHGLSFQQYSVCH